MTETDNRWNHLSSLEDEYLVGGYIQSEIVSELVRNAQLAFVYDAPIAAILSTQAALEAHLRWEFWPGERSASGFANLIDRAFNEGLIDSTIRTRLHWLRKIRNKWVHVVDPTDDAELLDSPDMSMRVLRRQARLSMQLLARVLYLNPWV